MKLTAYDLYGFKIIDEIIPEPSGGAHNNQEVAAANIKNAVVRCLDQLTAKPREQLLRERFDKFRNMGVFFEKNEKKKGIFRRLFGRRNGGR
jgi:acetyl-CoA carboxylase carboxyl transferase subunit alpha